MTKMMTQAMQDLSATEVAQVAGGGTSTFSAQRTVIPPVK
jgi:hypothetical protein